LTDKLIIIILQKILGQMMSKIYSPNIFSAAKINNNWWWWRTFIFGEDSLKK